MFAKGDRRLAPVILEAYKRGCYFDGWEECFKYDTWMQVFEDLGVDPRFYCQRPIGLDEVTLGLIWTTALPMISWCGSTTRLLLPRPPNPATVPAAAAVPIIC